MCLIVYKQGEDASFSNNNFKRAINNGNEDGFGIMYVEDGRVKVEKSLGKPEEQLSLYKTLKGKDTFALHLRLKTHGEVDEENIHPFCILNKDDGDPIDLFMMHNGVIRCDSPDKAYCDSYNFAKYYLKPMLKADPYLIDNKYWQEMVVDYIGVTNKLLFMNSEGETWIINEDKGEYVDGSWLSSPHYIKGAKKDWYSSYNNGSNKSTYTGYGNRNYPYQCNTPVVNTEKEIEEAFESYPDDSKSTNLIQLPRKEIVTDPNEIIGIDDLVGEYIDVMGGMSINQINEIVLQEPDIATEIINELLYYYSFDNAS